MSKISSNLQKFEIPSSLLDELEGDIPGSKYLVIRQKITDEMMQGRKKERAKANFESRQKLRNQNSKIKPQTNRKFREDFKSESDYFGDAFQNKSKPKSNGIRLEVIKASDNWFDPMSFTLLCPDDLLLNYEEQLELNEANSVRSSDKDDSNHEDNPCNSYPPTPESRSENLDNSGD